MAIDRRTVLGGLLAAPVVLQLPVQAAAPEASVEPLPVPTHPLFGIHTGPEVLMWGAHRSPDSGGRGFYWQVEAVPLDEERFGEFEDAEDEILARIVRDATLRVRLPSATDVNPENAIRINRVSNQIATRSLRGAGNVVLMHEADLVHLQNGRVCIALSTEDQTMGRWRLAAFMNANVTIWTTRCPSTPIPRYSAIIGYRSGNARDTGAHVTRLDDGRYAIAMVPPQPEEDLREPIYSPYEIAAYYSGKTMTHPEPWTRSKVLPISMTSYFGVVELSTPETGPFGFVGPDGKPLGLV